MSQPDLVTNKNVEPEETVTVKPRFNVYTMMMLLSLCAIITACVLLYFELDSYTPDTDNAPWPWDTTAATR